MTHTENCIKISMGEMTKFEEQKIFNMVPKGNIENFKNIFLFDDYIQKPLRSYGTELESFLPVVEHSKQFVNLKSCLLLKSSKQKSKN